MLALLRPAAEQHTVACIDSLILCHKRGESHLRQIAWISHCDFRDQWNYLFCMRYLSYIVNYLHWVQWWYCFYVQIAKCCYIGTDRKPFQPSVFDLGFCLNAEPGKIRLVETVTGNAHHRFCLLNCMRATVAVYWILTLNSRAEATGL